MTAAYDTLSRLQAAALVSEGSLDSSPASPVSGVNPVGARGDELNAAERDRAFRAVYDDHVAFVWRNLRRLGVADRDVEDRVQEVFVVAHRRFPTFEDRGHGAAAWLFQIILRVASDARRHRRRHPVDPDGGVAVERQSVEPAQASALARKQALGLLDRALEAVEVGRRAVLVLHEIEQMTAPEIARTLEIPLNTVYSRLRIARVELDEALTRLGVEVVR